MVTGRKLSRDFYLVDAVTLARRLLGKVLVHRSPEGVTSGLIVETEAYMGIHDKASHAYGGKRTRRNEVMYLEGGHAYIYLNYGIHHLLNVVAGPRDVPMAVLIRAVEPLEGVELMARRRGIELDDKSLYKLCNGPGKLTKAMGISVRLNGEDLTGDRLYIIDPGEIPDKIVSTRRIGVDYAGEYALKPWRFYIAGSRYVSRIG